MRFLLVYDCFVFCGCMQALSLVRLIYVYFLFRRICSWLSLDTWNSDEEIFWEFSLIFWYSWNFYIFIGDSFCVVLVSFDPRFWVVSKCTNRKKSCEGLVICIKQLEVAK